MMLLPVYHVACVTWSTGGICQGNGNEWGHGNMTKSLFLYSIKISQTGKIIVCPHRKKRHTIKQEIGQLGVNTTYFL